MKLFWLFYLGLFCTFSEAKSKQDWFAYFQNNQQQGQYLYQQGDFKRAAQAFKDPYRQGVALYRAGEYQQAIVQFKKVSRPAVKIAALYNLANSYVQVADYEEAIESYEKVLQFEPNNPTARFNLTISRTMLAQIDPEKMIEKNKDKEEKKEEKEEKKKKEQEDKEKESESESESGQQKQPLIKPQKIDKNIEKTMELWLEQIEGDPSLLLQNLFKIEEQQLQKEGVQHEIRPW